MTLPHDWQKQATIVGGGGNATAVEPSLLYPIEIAGGKLVFESLGLIDTGQGITRFARDKTQQDGRLDVEGRAKKLLNRAVWRELGCLAGASLKSLR